MLRGQLLLGHSVSQIPSMLLNTWYVRFFSRGYYVVEKVYSGFTGVHDDYRQSLKPLQVTYKHNVLLILKCLSLSYSLCSNFNRQELTPCRFCFIFSSYSVSYTCNTKLVPDPFHGAPSYKPQGPPSLNDRVYKLVKKLYSKMRYFLWLTKSPTVTSRDFKK